MLSTPVAALAMVLALVLCVIGVGLRLVPPVFRFAQWNTDRYRVLAAAGPRDGPQSGLASLAMPPAWPSN